MGRYPNNMGITIRCQDSRVLIPTDLLDQTPPRGGVLLGKKGQDITISDFGPSGHEGKDVIGRVYYHHDGNIFLTEEEILRCVYDGINRSLKGIGRGDEPESRLPVEMVLTQGHDRPEVGIYQISLDLTHTTVENPLTRRCLEMGFCRKEVENLPILLEINPETQNPRVDVVIPDVIEFV